MHFPRCLSSGELAFILRTKGSYYADIIAAGSSIIWRCQPKFAAMIQRDFGKRFFEELQAADCGTLIVDFVDERWDVLRSRDSFVTYSADLMHSNPQRLARYTFE